MNDLMIRIHRFRRLPIRVGVASRSAMIIFALLVVCAGGCQATRTSDRSIVAVDIEEAIAAVEGEQRGFRGLGGRTTGVWVDARTEAEFREGHIPGAVNLPLDRAREDHGALRGYNTIIVYGRDRDHVRATALSKLLMELGHRDVRTLQGGFEAWRNADKPVQQP